MAYEGWHLWGSFWSWAIEGQLDRLIKEFPAKEWIVAANGHDILYRNKDGRNVDGIELSDKYYNEKK